MAVAFGEKSLNIQGLSILKTQSLLLRSEARPAKARGEKATALPPSGVASPESTKWLQRQAKCARRRDSTPELTRGNRKSQFREFTEELMSKVDSHYLSRSQWRLLPNPTAR